MGNGPITIDDDMFTLAIRIRLKMEKQEASKSPLQAQPVTRAKKASKRNLFIGVAIAVGAVALTAVIIILAALTQGHSNVAILVIDVQNDFLDAHSLLDKDPVEARYEYPDLGSDKVVPSGSLPVKGSSAIIAVINKLIGLGKSSGHKPLFIFSLDWHPSNHCSFAKEPAETPFSVLAKSPENEKRICKDEKSKTLYEESKLRVWPAHCVHGTVGARFPPDLDIPKTVNTFIVKKASSETHDSYSAMGGFESIEKFIKNNEIDKPEPELLKDELSLFENEKKRVKLQDILEANQIKKIIVVGVASDFCVHSTMEDLFNLKKQKLVVVEDAIEGVYSNSAGAFDQKLKDDLMVRFKEIAKVVKSADLTEEEFKSVSD